MSIKNSITTSVSHIQRGYEIITKTIHQTMNVLSTKAELFAIKCSISQASQMQGITSIVIITDVIHIAKHIFNIFIHSY